MGPSLMMGAAHGNLAGPISPSNDAKLSSPNPVGFTSAPSDEKVAFNNNNNNGSSTTNNNNALGMGGAGRLGLDQNALTVSKRLPKEETV